MAKYYSLSEVCRLVYPTTGDYDQSRLEELDLWCEDCELPVLVCLHSPTDDEDDDE